MQQSIFHDLHTSPSRGLVVEHDILCPDSQPFETYAQDLYGVSDDDETQIDVVAVVSEEECEDTVLDDEILDPTYEPPTVCNLRTHLLADDAVVLSSPPAQAVSAVSQSNTVPTGPNAVNPTVQPISGSPDTVRGKPRVSAVWAFFTQTPDRPTAVLCNLCKNTISRGRNPLNLSTTAMTRHMATKHSMVWHNRSKTDVATASESTTTASCSAAGQRPTEGGQGALPQAPSTNTESTSAIGQSHLAIQPSVHQMWSIKAPWPANHSMVKALNLRLAKLLAVEMLPYSMVDTESFRSFVALACPRYKIPSRHYFANVAIPALHQHVVDNITRSLHQSISANVHFTTDTWSSKHGQGRYITLTAHWVNLVQPTTERSNANEHVVLSPRLAGQSGSTKPASVASSSSTLTLGGTPVQQSACRGQRRQAVLHMRSLGDCRHTGDQLWSALSQDFQKWLAPHNLEPGYVVCDNATNLLSALRQGELIHIPCMAHVLNLVVQRFLKKYAGLQSLLMRVRDACAHFRRSPNSSSRLLMLQKTLGLPCNRLICDVSTRWNSTYQMLQRFCQQKRAIVDYALNSRMGQRSADAGHFTPSEWNQLQDLCTLLMSFQHATDMVSANDALLSISVPVVFLLEETLKNMRTEEHSRQEEEEEEFPEDDAEMVPIAPSKEMESRVCDAREGGGPSVGAASKQSLDAVVGSAVAEERDVEMIAQGPTEEHDLQDTGFERVLEEEDEEDEFRSRPTLLQNVAGSIGGQGSLSHMTAFMLHYLQYDPRIQDIKSMDHYWLATILDPRYKSRVADMLPSDVRAQRMNLFRNRLIEKLIRAFKPTPNADQASSSTRPQVSATQASTSVAKLHMTGGTSNYCANWQNFFRPTAKADRSDPRTESHSAYIKRMVAEYMSINFDTMPHVSCPFDFWVSKLDLWPELSKYALDVLSCPAASVLSERVFSSAGNILTDTRTRLSTASANRLTHIKMNSSWISA